MVVYTAIKRQEYPDVWTNVVTLGAIEGAIDYAMYFCPYVPEGFGNDSIHEIKAKKSDLCGSLQVYQRKMETGN